MVREKRVPEVCSKLEEGLLPHVNVKLDTPSGAVALLRQTQKADGVCQMQPGGLAREEYPKDD